MASLWPVSYTHLDVYKRQDVALALNAQPERFERNCAAIYLHAGAAQDDRQLEYNVALAPWAYARVHAAPCPLYWLPCFHRVPDWGKEDMRIGKHGTFYRFVQGAVSYTHLDVYKSQEPIVCRWRAA